MPREHMLHQTVLVSGPVRAESALELWIDATFEIVVPLQMVLVLVRFPASDTGVLENRGG